MTHTLTITAIRPVTHNVVQIDTTRPEGFSFEPGQATEVAIDKDGLREEKRPFTFTGLRDAEGLQFTIKVYPDHHGVTEAIGKLAAGDRLLIDDAWGTIAYKGKGTFIAGGAGVTPFIAILRHLARQGEIGGHRLIFANRTAADIILKDEFEAMPGLETLYVLSAESDPRYHHGRIDKAFLAAHAGDVKQHFYVCGPDKMVEDINAALKDLGADPDGLVFEQ